MEYLLRSKGLYRIKLWSNNVPTNDEVKVAKWDNFFYQAHGLIGMSIYPDLRFHLDGLYYPIEAWEKLNIVFGLKNEIWACELENELLSLHRSIFPSIEYLLSTSIEYLLSNFKTLGLLLDGCKVKNEEESLIYNIISKLGPTYSNFVSTFHPTRESLLFVVTMYKSPSFDAFYDSLIQEQEKLLHLGLLNLPTLQIELWFPSSTKVPRIQRRSILK